jgi:hypothetical protein
MSYIWRSTLACVNLDSITMSTATPTLPEKLSSGLTGPPNADSISTAAAGYVEK